MKSFDEIKLQKSFPELLLEREISSVIRTPERASNPALSPSGLGCPRGAAFKLSGAMMAASEETYESGLAAAMGTFIHERIQKFLSKSKIWVDVEEYIRLRPELGLSIAKEIIQSHNENINVVSTEGVGTEFIFTLEKASKV